MKKVIKGIVVVLLVLVIALVFFAGPIVKNAVNEAGPRILGVPVSLENAQVSLLQGLIKLDNLVIGNPEGFKTDSLFAMGGLNVDIDMASLFSDTILVHEITVTAPEITYEMTLSGSNVGALQKQLGGEESTDEKTDAEEVPAKAEGGKKVIIEKFLLNEGQINLSLPAMMGTAMPIPLPTVSMTDIGKEEEGGAGITDVIGKIFGAIFSTVTDVVTSSGKFVGDGVKAVGGAAVDGVTAVGGVAVDGVSAVGGAAVDGVGAVGGAAVGAGKAVGKGVSDAVGGVLNVFGGSEKKTEE